MEDLTTAAKIFYLVTAIAAGAAGIANAETNTGSNAGKVDLEQMSRQKIPFILREADGNLVSNDIYDLQRNQKTSMEDLLRGGNVIAIYALDPVLGLNNMITAMGGNPDKKGEPSVMDKFSPERAASIINDYRNDIKIINADQNPNMSNEDLNRLSVVVSDGLVKKGELKEIPWGYYMIKKIGMKEDGDLYSVPIIVYIGPESQAHEALSSPKAREGDETLNTVQTIEEAKKIQKEKYKAQVPQHEKSKRLTKKQKKALEHEPYPDYESTGAPAKYELPKQAQKAQTKEGPIVAIVGGGSVNSDFDYFQIISGLEVWPFQNKDFGFGVYLKPGMGLNQLVSSYSAPIVPGQTFEGTVTNTNRMSLGIEGAVLAGPFIFGGGVNYLAGTTATDEKIVYSDPSRKPTDNPSSKPYHSLDWNASLGLGTNPEKGAGAEVIVTYDPKIGIVVNALGRIKIK